MSHSGRRACRQRYAKPRDLAWICANWASNILLLLSAHLAEVECLELVRCAVDGRSRWTLSGRRTKTFRRARLRRSREPGVGHAQLAERGDAGRSRRRSRAQGCPGHRLAKRHRGGRSGSTARDEKSPPPLAATARAVLQLPGQRVAASRDAARVAHVPTHPQVRSRHAELVRASARPEHATPPRATPARTLWLTLYAPFGRLQENSYGCYGTICSAETLSLIGLTSSVQQKVDICTSGLSASGRRRTTCCACCGARPGTVSIASQPNARW